MLVREILKEKGGEVFSTHVDAIVYDALRVMNDKHIGALMVLDERGQVQGIITERDVIRVCYQSQVNCKGVSIRDVMTPRDKLIIAHDTDEIEALMNIMTENRIRHIPILDGQGALAGIVSIGDLIKAQLTDREYQIKHMRDYIDARYPM